MKYIQIKKIIFGLTMYLIIFFGFFHGITYVHRATCVSSNTNYCLLSPLPGLGDSVDTQTGVGNYINTMIRIVIGFMSVLAVVMFVIGGIQYMVSNMVGEKASAKDRMVNAVLGLILALSSYLILNTLNPKLVNLKIGIQGVAITQYDDEGDETYNGLTQRNDGRVYTGITLPLCNTVIDCANAILANKNIITLKPDAYNDLQSGADRNISDVSKGSLAWTSIRGVGSKQVTLDLRMLKGILAAASMNIPFTVTEIAGGQHTSPNSKHYSGSAIDIVPGRGLDLATDILFGSACQSAGATLVIAPCNTNKDSKKTVYCPATQLVTNSGHQNHIHCQW